MYAFQIVYSCNTLTIQSLPLHIYCNHFQSLLGAIIPFSLIAAPININIRMLISEPITLPSITLMLPIMAQKQHLIIEKATYLVLFLPDLL